MKRTLDLWFGVAAVAIAVCILPSCGTNKTDSGSGGDVGGANGGGGAFGAPPLFPMLPACRTSSDCSTGACEDCASGKCLITADASEKEEGRCWNLKECQVDSDCKPVGDAFGVDSWCWVVGGFGMCEPRAAGGAKTDGGPGGNAKPGTGSGGGTGTSTGVLPDPVPPVPCSTLLTASGAIPAEVGVCTATDPQRCLKTCGPNDIGFKQETCSGGTYREQSGCSFQAGVDYSCYKIPTAIAPSCPTTVPQIGQPCAVAPCVLCNVNDGYIDLSGSSRTGYCVCPATNAATPGKWTCADTLAWPCPAGQGC